MIDIVRRMLDWQAAIRKSNGDKDTPLSDACAEAAKEIERLRSHGQDEIAARAGYEVIRERVAKHHADFKGVGGDVNELVMVPAGKGASGVAGILKTLDDAMAAIERLRARFDKKGDSK